MVTVGIHCRTVGVLSRTSEYWTSETAVGLSDHGSVPYTRLTHPKNLKCISKYLMRTRTRIKANESRRVR